MKRIAGIDGLRAISVTAVVWHHSHPGWEVLPMSQRGFLGVDVFFVISGFLIATILLRERATTGSVSLRHFYIRRALRIFPLYYAVLLFLVLYFIFAGSDGQFFAELPYHASYTSNWISAKSLMGISWSLSAEEQFYLVWPLMLVFLPRIWIGITIAFLLFNQAVNFGLLDAWLNSIGLPYADLPILQATFTPILLGVLLATSLESDRVRNILAPFSGHMIWAGVFVLLATANVPVDDFRGLPRLVFHLAMALTIAGMAVRDSHPVIALLEWRPIAFVGVVSYGIYLLHKFPIYIADQVGLASRPLLYFLVSLLLTILVAAASYRFFERPILELKRKLRA